MRPVGGRDNLVLYTHIEDYKEHPEIFKIFIHRIEVFKVGQIYKNYMGFEWVVLKTPTNEATLCEFAC